MEKDKLKKGEFNAVFFKENEKRYYPLRYQILLIDKKGENAGVGTNFKDYTYKLIFENLNERDEFLHKLNVMFDKVGFIPKQPEGGTITEKEMKQKKKDGYKLIKNNESSKVRPVIKIMNLNKNKENINNKTFVQTAISGFEEKEINDNWKDSYLSKMFNEEGINKYKNDKSLDIVRSDIKGDQLISTWGQIMKDFLIDIYENFPRNKSIESENYILHYFVFKYRLVTKKLSNEGENLPSRNVIHVVGNYCKEPVTYNYKTTNGNKDYYLYRKQLKDKYGYDVTEIFKEYNKTKSTEEFITNCRKKLLFKN